MSPFLIFWIVLTVGYVLYYAFAISQEIVKLKKAGVKDANVEVFDTASFETDKPVEVKEHKGGFSVGGIFTGTASKKEAKAEEPAAPVKTVTADEKIEKITSDLADAEDQINDEMGFDVNEMVNLFSSSNGNSDMFNRIEHTPVAADQSSNDNSNGNVQE